MYGGGTWSTESPYGPVGGIHRLNVPSSLLVCFLVRVHDLCPFNVLWECYLPLSQLLPAPTASRDAHNVALGWGKRAMDLFGSILYSWGSKLPAHMLSLFPMEKITGKRSFLALSYATLENGWHKQSQTIPLTLSNASQLVYIHIFSTGTLVLHYTPGLLSRLSLSMGDYLRQCCPEAPRLQLKGAGSTARTKIRLPITWYRGS